MAIKTSWSKWLLPCLIPLIFACAHSKSSESDSYGEVGTEDGTVLMESDDALAQTEEAETPEGIQVTESEISVAQSQLEEQNPAPKKIEHPFSAPTTTAKKIEKPTGASIGHKIESARAVASSRDRQAPSTRVERNGSLLNRYYLARKDDSPQSLSSLFYGTPDRAAELVEWNGDAASWSAGKVIYYRSANSPEDERMASYYFEASTRTESVSVEAGDTLQSIAQQKYGSAESWREIALLNGLDARKDLKPGTQLKLYPVALTEQPNLKLAEVAPEPAPTIVERKPSKPSWAAGQITGFVRHNPIASACGVLALFLLAGFFIAQRKKYRSRFDF